MSAMANHDVGADASRAAEVLARRLTAWRREHGVPLRELASEMGVSISTVHSWEHGNRFPLALHLDKLAEHLDIPICALLFEGEGLCPRCGRDLPTVDPAHLN